MLVCQGRELPRDRAALPLWHLGLGYLLFQEQCLEAYQPFRLPSKGQRRE